MKKQDLIDLIACRIFLTLPRDDAKQAQASWRTAYKAAGDVVETLAQIARNV